MAAALRANAGCWRMKARRRRLPEPALCRHAGYFEHHHRLQRLAIAGGTQRRRIHVDTLLDDHAVFHDKLVDAALGKLPPRDEPSALPFDDVDVAAPAPVEQ